MRPLQTLPRLGLALDGAPLGEDALSEVRVTQALSVPAQCELVFRQPPGGLDDASRVRPGSRLELTVRGQPAPLFQGDVTAVEHVFEADAGREVRVRAYDPTHRLRKRQTIRVHVRVTAGGLAEELARDVGLAVRAEADGPPHEWIVQHHDSDLAMLVEALERCGLFYAVREGTLHLLTLEGIGEPLPLELGGSLLEARLELNDDGACSDVHVAGWDPVRAQTYLGRAAGPRSGREIRARLPEASRRTLVDQAAHDQRHADALAQAELDVRTTGEVRLWGVAEGDPRLRPGARVTLAGVGAAFSGRHVLTRVTHTIDERSGYVSTIETEPPRLGVRRSAAVVTEAIVTQVRDPERRGRVKARLPGYFDVETDWMPVITLGAGSGKGLQVQPDVDDTVLVLLAHEDPAEGVVLGGLYGLRDVPDAAGVVGGAVRRFQLRTPGGQVVRLDDERGGIVVEDRGGSRLELAPDRVTLHAAADLEIAAPGHRVVIRGRAIDFESAPL
ncbi:MAG TPA: phage baseplate assembly protein V [Candidatus Dormibacteraeota bacterium]